jgi:hypothetical protein
VRLIVLAAAALVAAAACSAPTVPSIRPPDPPPAGMEPFSALISGAQAWLEERTNRCEPRAVESVLAIRCVADYRDTPDAYYSVVDVLADADGLVTLVQATVDVSGGDRPDLTGFLGFYASTALGIVVDPAPQQAEAWLRTHVASPGSTVVGRLVLEMSIERTRSSLRIWQRR